MSASITVYVIGPKAANYQELDIIDIVERRPTGKMVTMVRYKGGNYPVIGRRGAERIYVGIQDGNPASTDGAPLAQVVEE